MTDFDHDDLDGAIDGIGGYEDEGYVEEQPISTRRRRSVGDTSSVPRHQKTEPPVSSRQTRQTGRGRRRTSDRQSAALEATPPQDGPGFMKRLLVAMIGAGAFVAGAVGMAWTEVQQSWHGALDGATFPLWQSYGVMAAITCGGVLIVGIIAALHDRSLWRVFLLGAVWAALVQIGVGYHARSATAFPKADDHVATGLAMTQGALVPLLAATRASEAEAHAQLSAKDETITTLQAHIAELQAEAETQQQALTEAQTAAEQATATASQLQASLTETHNATSAAEDTIAGLQADQAALKERLTTTQIELEANETLNSQLTAENQRLREQLETWRRQAENATQALTTAQAEAAALRAAQSITPPSP